MLKWYRVPCDPHQIYLPAVLRCGQSFRWRRNDVEGGTWSITLDSRVVLLKQDAKNLYFSSIPELASTPDLVKDYLNLAVDLKKLWNDWSSRDKRFGEPRLTGVRILRQDPWETLIAFICSSNNNIKRISKMVHSLCQEYGPYIAEWEGERYYGFPSPADLLKPEVEQRLRSLGFGYRAKYIVQTAKHIASMSDGLTYLHSLRDVPYEEAHAALTKFSGVGPKVADCVCLMSLDKHDVVPVDTHIWQIAQRDYKMRIKTQNAREYQQVQDAFRRLWGPHAGWAHSVLFAGDLPALEAIEPLVVKNEIEEAAGPQIKSEGIAA